MGYGKISMSKTLLLFEIKETFEKLRKLLKTLPTKIPSSVITGIFSKIPCFLPPEIEMKSPSISLVTISTKNNSNFSAKPRLKAFLKLLFSSSRAFKSAICFVKIRFCLVTSSFSFFSFFVLNKASKKSETAFPALKRTFSVGEEAK